MRENDGLRLLQKMMSSRVATNSSRRVLGRRVMNENPHRRTTYFSTVVPMSSSTASATISTRRSFFQWYSHKLDTHPILTKCVSAGAIATFGNILAQKIVHEKKKNKISQKGDDENENFQVDWGTVGRFAFLNVAYVGKFAFLIILTDR